MVGQMVAMMVVKKAERKAVAKAEMMADLWDPMMVDSKAERLVELMAD